ncbi:MAG TPA: M20/M25/M40 family metallo-hydrolase [Gemmatimonadaceae bacterium]|nr:M20/M25/M40 family metallo-hydrolase [Gemmatimonadaceae bacterium]
MPRIPGRLAALSALLLAATAATTVGAQSTTATATLTAHQRLARDVYRELIEINTVDSVGSVTKAAEAMAARFRAAGFPAADVQLLGPADKPTKTNLVVRYRGRGGPGAAKPILLIAHLDVVAANRADWPRDPFVLHEEGGYFLGRGTIDDKAMAAIFVANLLRWKQQGYVPARDVVLALTADEESGNANGAEWLTKNHRDLIDAAYAINEGAQGALDGDRPVYLAVQAAEKIPVNYTLTTTNPGGHSSIPRPDNAITQLADALARLARSPFPVALNPVSTAFFAQTAKVEKPEMAAAMRALVANPLDSAAAATVSRNPVYNSMLRTTCVATRLSGGHAYNALPQTASANVNCRIVPTQSPADVLAALARIVADSAVKVTFTFPPDDEHTPPAPRPVDPELLAAVTSLTRATWGNIPVIPVMSTWATDGAYLRAAGIPTYGVNGLFTVPGEENMHGRDEKLRVRSFYEGLDFLDQLVRRVAGPPARPRA